MGLVIWYVPYQQLCEMRVYEYVYETLESDELHIQRNEEITFQELKEFLENCHDNDKVSPINGKMEDGLVCHPHGGGLQYCLSYSVSCPSKMIWARPDRRWSFMICTGTKPRTTPRQPHIHSYSNTSQVHWLQDTGGLRA